MVMLHLGSDGFDGELYLDCSNYAVAGLCMMSMANDPRGCTEPYGKTMVPAVANAVMVMKSKSTVKLFKIRGVKIAQGREILYKYSDRDTFFTTSQVSTKSTISAESPSPTRSQTRGRSKLGFMS